MKDIENLIVAIICAFIMGNAFHSTWAHYLPDGWSFWKWLEELISKLRNTDQKT